MNTSQSNSARRPVPWLVTVSDLRRYLGRALDQCDRGRVVFFFYRPRSGAGKGRSFLVSLIPAGAEQHVLDTAVRDFRSGRFQIARLATMPRESHARRRRVG